MLSRFRHIVVEGPVGSGKTALANRLIEHVPALRDALQLFDIPEANPWLERYGRDPARYALHAQTAFLFQRSAQLHAAGSVATTQPLIGDFLFERNMLYAGLTLTSEELALYRKIHAAAALQPASPDLVIFLQTRPENLLERLARRGNALDLRLPEAFVRAMCAAYDRLAHDYDSAPVMIVGVDALHPAYSDVDFTLLLEHLEQMRGRRAFLNMEAD